MGDCVLTNCSSQKGEYFEAPALSDLLQVWTAKRGMRWLPAREDFDPLELKRFLGDIYLVDAEEWPKRLRYRLVGTNICSYTGQDLTNRYFDEIYRGRDLRAAMRAQGRAIESAGPARLTGEARCAENTFVDCEAAVLPLSRDQVRIDMLLCMMAFGPRRFRF